MIKKFSSSFTAKLHRVFVFSTAAVLFLAGVAALTFETFNSRGQLINRAESFGALIAGHTGNALIADTPDLAEVFLRNTLLEQDLVAIYVYNDSGQLFSSVKQPDIALAVPSILLRSSLLSRFQFNQNLFEYSRPLRVNDELVGQLYLQYDLTRIEQYLIRYLIFGLFLYFASMVAVYLLSKRIQRGVAEPIDRILQTMQAITEKQHFGVRIRGSEAGEIGAIIKGFNKMIAQIDKNNRKLHQQRQEIEQHVFYDVLTGLPNRRMLLHQMEQEIARSRRSRQKGALLYLDLDHFKTINDSLGHNVGDELLKTVSDRIQDVIREADTPARLGGDEFVVLLPELGANEVKASNNALSVAEKVRSAISKQYNISNRILHVTPSIGIVLFDEQHHNFDTLIMQADLAMYRAKDEGRNRVQFFLSYMQENADHRQQIEERLRRAINHHQLKVYYQPQLDGQGEIVGAEALIRWQDESCVWINPASFIPIAEMTDLICMLGRWVLGNVCRQMVKWMTDDKYLTLSVNISPREFQQRDFVENVEEIILSTGARAEYLVFELTEGVLLNDIEGTIAKMKRLATLGIRFSLDDFGTGYSSLQYLKQLPLDTLKIDQSFVRDITTDPNDAAIVTTIIAMSKHLNMKVIAEGVEKQEELDFLKRNGCDQYQGYLFYKPMPENEIDQLMASLDMKQANVAQIISGPEWLIYD
ncbi:putative bifunctional diguanylate cyclase/phosphodiesterase [Amphritea sp. HPY]|uniref:putative bifunctional diguanylate cyclase/phosphodiesterase n=1 Tax=Amphritea sp. HPY TaxID=3421652 RepID=UPI003D7D8E23